MEGIELAFRHQPYRASAQRAPGCLQQVACACGSEKGLCEKVSALLALKATQLPRAELGPLCTLLPASPLPLICFPVQYLDLRGATVYRLPSLHIFAVIAGALRLRASEGRPEVGPGTPRGEA